MALVGIKYLYILPVVSLNLASIVNTSPKSTDPTGSDPDRRSIPVSTGAAFQTWARAMDRSTSPEGDTTEPDRMHGLLMVSRSRIGIPTGKSGEVFTRQTR